MICRGYWSPEYAIHGHISTALDVFSFGIVILEIISGRKNVDNQKSSEEVYLRDWVCTYNLTFIYINELDFIYLFICCSFSIAQCTSILL